MDDCRIVGDFEQISRFQQFGQVMVQFVEFLMHLTTATIRTVVVAFVVLAVKVMHHGPNGVQLFLGERDRAAAVERLEQKLLGQFAHQPVLALDVCVTQFDGKEIEEVAGGLPVWLDEERPVRVVELLQTAALLPVEWQCEAFSLQVMFDDRVIQLQSEIVQRGYDSVRLVRQVAGHKRVHEHLRLARRQKEHLVVLQSKRDVYALVFNSKVLTESF